MGKIFNLLESLDLISKDTIEVFSESTRDVKNLKVFRDLKSDIIFIDDFFVGEDVYIQGEYRENEATAPSASIEDIADNNRRASDFINFYENKVICDYGCGQGTFLSNTFDKTKNSFGIEVQENFINELNKINIKCHKDISFIDKDSLDACFLFHVLEHFENPIHHLELIRDRLAKDGKIVIEVPHARDFLIKDLKIQEFINFTLWSQHLILHTRESLEKFLLASGYKNIQIYGTQRFSISNHIQWAKDRIPGGHRSEIAKMETPELVNAYEKTLDKLDATDTLIAIAEK